MKKPRLEGRGFGLMHSGSGSTGRWRRRLRWWLGITGRGRLGGGRFAGNGRLAGLRADAFDGVAQLAADDEVGIPGPGIQALVEQQFAAGIGPDQLELAQLLDEATEQGLVEELRRGRGVEQAQTLGRLLAQAFQLGSVDVRRVLYMATWSAIRCDPDIGSCYRRLVDAGKPRKTAAIACMRKYLTRLNAMKRDNTPWQSVPMTT